jgi:ADP-ribose pyrophosphatase
MTLFWAEGLTRGRKNLDHDEWIEHQEVPLKEAVRMIRNGTIQDGKTIAGILWAWSFKV